MWRQRLSHPQRTVAINHSHLITLGSKIMELEEELKVVGSNVKSLEVSEEKSMKKQDEYEETIQQLTTRLKEAESRAEFAERTVLKLQKAVESIEGQFVSSSCITHNSSSSSHQINSRTNGNDTRRSPTRWIRPSPSSLVIKVACFSNQNIVVYILAAFPCF